MTPGFRASLARAFDRVYSDAHRAWLDHAVVNVSAAGFLLHLLLVFLSRTLASPPAVVAAVGRNYLATIYTPFSFILFYEVLMLIAALPQSTTSSIAKQYEIVSLIVIRRFFRDIAELDDIGKLAQLSPEVVPVLLDVGAGLLMFLLVTVFVHAGRRRVRADTRPESEELKKFISRKKTIALALTVLLVSLAAYSLGMFAYEAWQVIYQGATANVDPNTFFYSEVFTVMIFTDVLIVILSLAVSDRYELVFRNAAFVISTILIRFSLTTERQYSALLAVAGMVFGIVTLVVYNYHARVRALE
ncbi:MAG TPA: hypothetical protein VH157_07850 [Bryobacteraceae bacterium]|jgi:hypothetical protein|nr:hypothetical protein [Bryobacteraceae bacterium]